MHFLTKMHCCNTESCSFEYVIRLHSAYYFNYRVLNRNSCQNCQGKRILPNGPLIYRYRNLEKCVNLTVNGRFEHNTFVANKFRSLHFSGGTHLRPNLASGALFMICNTNILLRKICKKMTKSFKIAWNTTFSVFFCLFTN